MSKKKNNSKNICDRCGSQIKYFPCSSCGGSGQYREWIFFKRECGVCSGTGKVLRCPNEFKHIMEDLKLSPTFSANSLYRNFRNITPPGTSFGQKEPLPNTTFVQKKPIPNATFEQKKPLPSVKFGQYRPLPNTSFNRTQIPPPWHPSYPNPWHPLHPNNPRNNPFNPLNPNSPNNPHNFNNPNNPLNPMNPNNPMK